MTVRAMVRPALLIWARESAGLSIEVAARKVGVKPERLAAWEEPDGDARPTIRQLRELGRIYKRPLAVFYLPEPPRDFDALHDFRRLPGQVAGLLSPELRLEERRAHERREAALDLLEVMGDAPPEFALDAALADQPEDVATRLRSVLGITVASEHGWKDKYTALRGWRQAIEQQGVLVFQFSGVEIDQARGFSISLAPLPVIAVNTKDSPRGRVFSMLHELTHIALREGGLCDLGESDRPPEERRVEVFCNAVAGATLVPGEHLLASQLVRRHGISDHWSDDDISALANGYQVSRETVLRRLLDLGRIRRAFYRQKQDEYRREYEAASTTATSAPVPHYRRKLNAAGPTFVRLALASYHQDKITASDLSDYLDVRLKHIPDIEREVARA